MYNPTLIIPLVLWLITFGITSVFHQIVRKKIGVQSEAYACFKQPHFISNMLNSIVSVGLILFIMNSSSFSPEHEAYLVVPYFGITAYYITSAFRALKDARND